MCENCGGAAERPTEPKGKWTRRQLLGMGVCAGAGIALGVFSWQNQEENPPTTTKPSAKTQGAPSQTQPNPATTNAQPPGTPQSSPTPASAKDPEAALGPDSRPVTTQEGSAASQAAGEGIGTTAPDLGAEVFPDASGRAIARPNDAPVIIVPRTDWTEARPNLEMIVPMEGVHRITVHHTAGAMQTDAWAPTAGQLESIREFHSGSGPNDRHWADIAYHFAVDRAGRVWQARPLAYQGAHARQNNAHNMGIVLLGNFEVQSPSAAQLTALREFIGFVRKLYQVPLGEVHTHRELVQTECPGKLLQAFMDRMRADGATV